MTATLNIRAHFPRKLAALDAPARYKFIRGGRGSGKSWGVARKLLLRAAATPDLRILCTREVQKSIQQSVHQLLRDQITALGLDSRFQVLQTEIRGTNGSRFFFSGLSDQTADSIKSFEGADIVWCEEAQTITRRSWRILTPTIRKPGSEIWATYNPALDSDETHQMAVVNPAPGTVSIEMNWQDNPFFPAVLEQERRHAFNQMSPEEYGHIWEGRCMPAVEGAIYFNEIAQAEQRGAIRPAPIDPMLRVHRVWDLGWNDSMSIILAQRSGTGEVRIVDYIEDSHRTLDSYAAQLRALPISNWGDDWLPHDGFAKEFRTGKSAEEILTALGCTVRATPRMELEGGIRATRQAFGRLYFNADAPGVARLVECCKRYRRGVPARTGEPGAPLHDEYSHGADALRYLALASEQFSNETWGGAGGRLAYPRLGYA